MKAFLFKLRRRLSLDGYATGPAWFQLIVLIFVSALLIFLFIPLVGSLDVSYKIFTDPAAVADAEGTGHISFAILELIVGLVVAGFVISILTTSLEKFIEQVKSGSIPYRRKGHILIVGENEKLSTTLCEIDSYCTESNRFTDVVILTGNHERVEGIRDELERIELNHLQVTVKYGDLFSSASYEKVNAKGAYAILVLRDESAGDELTPGNAVLKSLGALFALDGYREHLAARMKSGNPQHCCVEIDRTSGMADVARALTTVDGLPQFGVVEPYDYLNKILNRSVVDIVYYHLYVDLFSFDGHEIYYADAARFGYAGMTFREAVLGTVQGVVIGIASGEPGKQKSRLNPPADTVISAEDMVIVIAVDEDDIQVKKDSIAAPAGTVLQMPSEVVHRRICVLGNHHPFASLFDFLDDESRAESRTVVLGAADDYFADELLTELHDGGYDSVILNLADDTAFRLATYMHARFGADDALVKGIVTVMNDPVTAQILGSVMGRTNIILSDRIIAQMMTQVMFQNMLVDVFGELVVSDGNEFNILEAGKDIILPKGVTAAQVRSLLFEKGMIYIGTVDSAGKVTVEADRFEDAMRIVVICSGTR